jgi:Protein of unknown function (DUF3631)
LLIWKKVFSDRSQMPTSEILETLQALDESPWSDLRGKPLDPRNLATRLSQYDVKAKQIWFGSKQARGYDRDDLKQVWARYLHPTPAGCFTSVTSVTAPPMTGDVTDVTDVTCFSGYSRDRQLRLTTISGPIRARGAFANKIGSVTAITAARR